MVDVSAKRETAREAVARAVIRMRPATLRAVQRGDAPKGDVLGVARTAGILAAKRTPELIPLCHVVPLDGVDVDAALVGEHVEIRAEARAEARTGVEMEALVAAAVAALTVIDMGKAIDRGMVIEGIRLLEKTGGTRGDYRATARLAEDSQRTVRSRASSGRGGRARRGTRG
jgi:cyclic pyranopterin phosphate synthase